MNERTFGDRLLRGGIEGAVYIDGAKTRYTPVPNQKIISKDETRLPDYGLIEVYVDGCKGTGRLRIENCLGHLIDESADSRKLIDFANSQSQPLCTESDEAILERGKKF